MHPTDFRTTDRISGLRQELVSPLRSAFLISITKQEARQYDF